MRSITFSNFEHTQALPFNKQKSSKRGVFKYNFADRVNRIVLLTTALLVVGGIVAVPVAGVASLGQMAYMVGAVAFALYFMVSERNITHTNGFFSVVLAT
jgi:hypothetical protein